MKIKHFMGYGCVKAIKNAIEKKGDYTYLTVTVRGNHEYGLVRDDDYDLFRWLVKRFVKDADNYRQIEYYTYSDGFDHETKEEVVVYYFKIRNEK